MAYYDEIKLTKEEEKVYLQEGHLLDFTENVCRIMEEKNI
jgi:hypothetical protein